MNSCMNEYRVQCQSCRAEIGVRGIPPSHDNAALREKAIQRDSLNEILVDYGWLPTSKARAGGASKVFVIDDQHPCKAASMMDVYAPTPGADANDVLEDSSWL
jgi:hypothetical protein